MCGVNVWNMITKDFSQGKVEKTSQKKVSDLNPNGQEISNDVPKKKKNLAQATISKLLLVIFSTNVRNHITITSGCSFIYN